MIDIPGFQIEEKIYDSVRSVVYRAKQTAVDRTVILKTLKEEYPDPQEILRYRQEYETTRHLNFDGIPRPIGLERVRNRLILITEDIGGQIEDIQGAAGNVVEAVKEMLLVRDAAEEPDQPAQQTQQPDRRERKDAVMANQHVHGVDAGRGLAPVAQVHSEI